MGLYLAVSRFNSAKMFQSLLVKNNSFKDLQPEWHLLFTERNIFQKLQKFNTSIERSQFNFLVLAKALQNEYDFMVDEILDGRTPVTNKVIELLIKQDQKQRLIQLIAIPKDREEYACRPKFIEVDDIKRQMKSNKLKNALNMDKRESLDQNIDMV